MPVQKQFCCVLALEASLKSWKQVHHQLQNHLTNHIPLFCFQVAEITEASKQDTMSQLNPDAAEFVPVSSPTRNITSPACAALINDPVVSQSPRRAIIPGVANTDISIPNIQEFENEVKRRPSEVFCGNGHENESVSIFFWGSV